MKKVVIGMLVCGIAFGLSGCGSNENKTTKASSSVEQSTEDSSAKEAEKMKKIEEKLNDEGVTIKAYGKYVNVTREKGIDYDYFEMVFGFNKVDIVINTILRLRGNIDGEDKDSLFYKVQNNRVVEDSRSNTDITEMSEILKSLDISDQELVEFVQWYYQNNKK